MVARLWPPRALRAGRHGHGRQWKHLRRSSRRRQTRWALRRHATEGKDRLAAGCPGRHAGFNLGRGGCNQGESRGGIWGPVTSKAKRDGAERGASWIGVSLTWDAICKVPRWKTLMLLPPPQGGSPPLPHCIGVGRLLPGRYSTEEFYGEGTDRRQLSVSAKLRVALGGLVP